MATSVTLQGLPVVGATTGTVAAQARSREARRLPFIDNLRTFLTVLVVVFHLAITYGAEGSWYYIERPVDDLSALVLTMFILLNQWFFMGLFFLISGYFVPQALDRKGTWDFLRDRLIRLGIPLVLFTLIVSPIIEYVKAVQRGWYQGSLLDFALSHFGRLDFAPGPLWFVETLLAFSIVYVVGRAVLRRVVSRQVLPAGIALPLSNKLMVAFALAVAVASFAERLAMPVGDEWAHLQLGFYPQYAGMFAAGILAAHHRWLPDIPARIARVWKAIAYAALATLMPILIAGNAPESFEPFAGGPTWQALAIAIWEGFYTLGMAVLLLSLSRRHFDSDSRLARVVSANAYTVYIIHPLVIIPVAMVLSPVVLFPLLKWTVVSPLAVVVCFLCSHYLVRRIPLATKVL